ncbi:MAG: hypothetical protein IPN69_06960 [Acidobacteria bacterium]|nr:hypothetical protein [Acidobacteriota bacterium]
MNLKSVQNKYDLLTMRERFALLHAASIRKDEIECGAVHAASQRVTYRVFDFHFLAEKVLLLHNINLLERLNHQAMFKLFNDFHEFDDERTARYLDSTQLAAYLYVLETDAWKNVGEEFGFDVPSFREHLAEESLVIRQMEFLDVVLRGAAFNVEGARKVIARYVSVDAAKDIKTLESVTEQYRSILNACI